VIIADPGTTAIASISIATNIPVSATTGVMVMTCGLRSAVL